MTHFIIYRKAGGISREEKTKAPRTFIIVSVKSRKVIHASPLIFPPLEAQETQTGV